MNPIPFDERLRWELEQEEYIRKQLPSPYPDHLFGLKPQPPDPRNWNAAHDPCVAENLRIGTAPEGDITKLRKGPSYNQGGTPACVCHTAAGGASIFQQREETIWRTFAAMALHQETGSMSEGRYPVDILKVLVERGIADAASGERFKLTGFAYVQPGPEWVATIEATLADDRPVWICLLLPSNFGWESSGSRTSGYHEVLIVGWRPDAFLIWNSWGDSWGRNGLGWIPKAFLMDGNWQNGLCQAHIPTDEILAPTPTPTPTPSPIPTPTPTPQGVSLAARAAGGGLEFLKAGISLAASGEGFNGTLDVTEVKRDEEDKPPPPPPPTGLTVTAYTKRLFRNKLAVWISVRDQGVYVDAMVDAYVDGKLINTNHHWRNGTPAVFVLDSMAGTALRFDARAAGDKGGRLEMAAPSSGVEVEPPSGFEDFLPL